MENQNNKNTMSEEIKKFNEVLVDEKSEITVIEYIKELNNKFYKIDIAFIDDFIDLIDREDFSFLMSFYSNME